MSSRCSRALEPAIPRRVTPQPRRSIATPRRTGSCSRRGAAPALEDSRTRRRRSRPTFRPSSDTGSGAANCEPLVASSRPARHASARQAGGGSCAGSHDRHQLEARRRCVVRSGRASLRTGPPAIRSHRADRMPARDRSSAAVESGDRSDDAVQPLHGARVVPALERNAVARPCPVA